MESLMFFYEKHILNSTVLLVLDILVTLVVGAMGVGLLDWSNRFLAAAAAYLGVRSLLFLVWRIWLELPAPD